jgi:hypothetical protein
MEPDMWWNYHHEHLDWLGRGNIRWVYRCHTIRAHLLLMHRMVEQLTGFEGAFQTFLTVQVPDSANDAVYLHSPNPHSAFPIDFSGTHWDTGSAPESLRALGPSNMFWGHDPERGFYGFLDGVGVDPRR